MKRFICCLVLLSMLACYTIIAAIVTEQQPLTLEEKQQTLVNGNNAFAFDMYKAINKDRENTFFSPYSISTAFGMAYAGSAGQTEKEIATTLHYTLSDADMNPAFKALQGKLNAIQAKGQVKLSIANAAFLAERLKNAFKPQYLELVQDNYSSEVSFLDFNDSVLSTNTINNWVDIKTNHLIPRVIEPELIAKETAMVLVNAIYFKGDWQSPFDKENTSKDDFLTEQTGKGIKANKVDMMHQQASYQYKDLGNFKMIQLPYKGDDLSMLVLLPKKIDGILDLEKRLSSDNLEAWKHELRYNRVDLSLPKFKIEKTYDKMEVDFQKMGMEIPFSDEADFSKMKSGNQLYISKVIHKAYLAVDETGTEAAAVTAIMMCETMAPPPSKTEEFKADHPFICIIQDNATGSILFMGKIENPGKL